MSDSPSEQVEHERWCATCADLGMEQAATPSAAAAAQGGGTEARLLAAVEGKNTARRATSDLEMTRMVGGKGAKAVR